MLRKGFTLIELLIVMAVIAVLIGIAIPSFRGMQEEAKKTKAGGDIRVLKLAVEAYNAKYSAYPTTLASVEGGSVVQTLPKDPFSDGGDENYGYSLSAGNYYVIYSCPFSSTTPVTISWSGSTPTPSTTGVTVGSTNGSIPATEVSYWK
ncbi:MAG: prepilin-type N-terminal cleavage/methylation domain-containing protein [Candidatus Margulisiibacteriota bacterium]